MSSQQNSIGTKNQILLSLHRNPNDGKYSHHDTEEENSNQGSQEERLIRKQ